MRLIRLLVLLTALALPLVVTASAGALDIETDTQPPAGEVGTEYEFAFEADEGCVPYRFSYLNGTVPPGLHITTDGKLVGTPTEAGTFDFWVGLDDNSGPSNPYCTVPSVQSQGEFTMVVLPDLAVTTTSLPNALPGKPYSFQLQFSNPEFGWPVTWSIVAGTLPAGLQLSSSGVISGTPTGVDRKTFTVRAAEPFRRWGEQELTLAVGAAVSASPSFGAGEVGLPYRASVQGSGGTAPLTYAVDGKLPAGLTLDAKSGAVSGTPKQQGVYSFAAVVTDATGQKATAPVVVRIAGALTVATSRLRVAKAGSAFTTKLRASGGLAPRTWSVAGGALPRGLRLDPARGTIAGVPKAPGVYRFTVQARDRLGATAKKALALTVK